MECLSSVSVGVSPLFQSSSEESSTSLPCLPSLLEYLSFVFFPAAVLVGPVFSLRPYLEYIESQNVS